MYPAAAVVQGPPLRYTIDPCARLLVIELLSIADGSALLGSLRNIRRDPQFDTSYGVCVDCNALRRVPSSEDVKRLARLCVACPRTGSPSRWALIATLRPLNQAAWFFATAVSAPKVTLRVFETWSDAEVWLGTGRPVAENAVPWIGPSRALNELVRRSVVSR